MINEENNNFKIILSENLFNFVPDNMCSSGNCHCLIENHKEKMIEYQKNGWLLIKDEDISKYIYLLPRFVEDNLMLFLDKPFNFEYRELQAMKLELQIKYEIYKNINKSNYAIDHLPLFEKIYTDLVKDRRNDIKSIFKSYGEKEKSFNFFDKYSINSLKQSNDNEIVDKIYECFLSYIYIRIVAVDFKSYEELEEFMKNGNNEYEINYLVGNGFSIALNSEYSNENIIARISEEGRGLLKQLSNELSNLLSGLKEWEISSFKNCDYSYSHSLSFTGENDLEYLFYKYYKYFEKNKKIEITEIGIEDYFYIVNLLLQKSLSLKNPEKNKSIFQCSANKESLKKYLTESIISINTNIDENKFKKIETFYYFGKIFTTNYDLNLELYSEKECYHLHGGFDLWYKKDSNSKEIKLINGSVSDYSSYLEDGYIPDIILNLSRYKEFDVNDLKYYGMMRASYSYAEFRNINHCLVIYGFSGESDYYINKLIRDNKNVKKIVYIYYNNNGETFTDQQKFKICKEFSYYNKELIFINSKVINEYFGI